MLGQEIHIHHAFVGEIRHLIESGHRRHGRTPADIDEDLLGLQHGPADLHGLGPDERAMALKHRAAFELLERALHAIARRCHDRILARLDGFHVDRDRPADGDAVVGMAARQMRRIGACHHRLGRRAAIVDAGAAEVSTLDHRDLAPGRNEAAGKRRSGLTGPDDDGIEFRHGVLLPAALSAFCRSTANNKPFSSPRLSDNVSPQNEGENDAFVDCGGRRRAHSRAADVRAGAEARDDQGSPRRRRQDLALLSAAHRHGEARLLQGSRPRCRDFGLRGRRALAAGADGRERRCGHRLVRSHHPDPGEGRADRRAGADGPLPGVRAGAAQGEGRRLQEPEGPEGHENRRHCAGLLDALHGALHDGAGRAEAGGRLVHRHGLRQHRACRREARRSRRRSPTPIR